MHHLIKQTNMKLLTAISIFILASIQLQAQFFVPRLTQDQITACERAYVITMEGDTIEGNLRGLFMDNDRIRNFTIKNKQGKFKFNTENAKSLIIRPWFDPSIDTGPLNIPEVLRALDPEFNEIIVLDYVFFDRIQLPGKKEKYAFVQLENPGFDSRLKFYINTNNENETAEAKVGTITIAGGDPTTHLMVIDGGKAKVIRKRKYQEIAFTKIFTDCEAMKDNYTNNERLKWKDIAKHVYLYDQCQ